MTFNEFLKIHKVNGYALCDVNGPHYLSDEEIQLLSDVWNTAINSAICSVGSVSGDNTEELHALKKLLTSEGVIL